MTLANKLTILRIALIPLVVLALVPFSFYPASLTTWLLTPAARFIALLAFVVASVTDWFDGRIARRHGAVTTFGAFMDPIADKLLVVSTFIAFVALKRLSVFVPIVILARELAISGVRMVAAEQGVVMAAGRAGKVKTASQMLALVLLLVEPIAFRWLGVGPWLSVVADAMTALAVVLTIVSFALYLRTAWPWFSTSR